MCSAVNVGNVVNVARSDIGPLMLAGHTVCSAILRHPKGEIL